ncbi:hypothetical protein QE152_g3737 [Popillia japonica]|uniref:Uncharacterized protein n=1 Tax=Popillia japonica TaxID=7064 RepID=A0AAW1N2W9_POPJA
MAKRIMNWRVIDEENLTDHRYIGYEIKVDQAPERVVEKRKFITDWNAFRAHLQRRLCNMSDEDKRSHKLCIEIIREAYLNSRNKGPRGERAVPYWWGNMSDEDKRSHKLCIEIIREAYLNSRSEGPRGERAVPYWWDSAISEKRKECNRIRRQYTEKERM